MNYTMNEMKRVMQIFSSIHGQPEDQKKGCELRKIMWNYPFRGENRKKEWKSEESLHQYWDTLRWNNIHIIGIPVEEERERERGRKLI